MIDDLKETIELYKDFVECETATARVLRNAGNENSARDYEETAENDKRIVALLTELQERREADRWNVIHTEADLPNKEGYYLVDCKERVFSIQRLNFSIADHKPYWSGMCKVYAWRPLPKSYTGSEV